jgi:hypothetical protein
VDQHAGTISDRLDHCVAGANALPPGLMTGDERLNEIAAILAAGLLRLRRRLSSNDHSKLEKNSLDFPADRSGHVTARKRRKLRR